MVQSKKKQAKPNDDVFKKQKQRLGKSKLRPVNATTPTVKRAKLVLSNSHLGLAVQPAGTFDSEVLAGARLNGYLAKLVNETASVRAEAAGVLSRGLRNGAIHSASWYKTATAVLALMADSHEPVRTAASEFLLNLNRLLATATSEASAPLVVAAASHLNASLSHADINIRKGATHVAENMFNVRGGSVMRDQLSPSDVARLCVTLLDYLDSPARTGETHALHALTALLLRHTAVQQRGAASFQEALAALLSLPYVVVDSSAAKATATQAAGATADAAPPTEATIVAAPIPSPADVPAVADAAAASAPRAAPVAIMQEGRLFSTQTPVAAAAAAVTAAYDTTPYLIGAAVRERAVLIPKDVLSLAPRLHGVLLGSAADGAAGGAATAGAARGPKGKGKAGTGSRFDGLFTTSGPVGVAGTVARSAPAGFVGSFAVTGEHDDVANVRRQGTGARRDQASVFSRVPRGVLRLVAASCVIDTPTAVSDAFPKGLRAGLLKTVAPFLSVEEAVADADIAVATASGATARGAVSRGTRVAAAAATIALLAPDFPHVLATARSPGAGASPLVGGARQRLMGVLESLSGPFTIPDEYAVADVSAACFGVCLIGSTTALPAASSTLASLVGRVVSRTLCSPRLLPQTAWGIAVAVAVAASTAHSASAPVLRLCAAAAPSLLRLAQFIVEDAAATTALALPQGVGISFAYPLSSPPVAVGGVLMRIVSQSYSPANMFAVDSVVAAFDACVRAELHRIAVHHAARAAEIIGTGLGCSGVIRANTERIVARRVAPLIRGLVSLRCVASDIEALRVKLDTLAATIAAVGTSEVAAPAPAAAAMVVDAPADDEAEPVTPPPVDDDDVTKAADGADRGIDDVDAAGGAAAVRKAVWECAAALIREVLPKSVTASV